MSKLIDAEKLIAEIERKMKCWEGEGLPKGIDSPYCTLKGVRTFVESLQQEQPEMDLEKEMDKYFSNWLQGASDEGCFNADSQLVSIYDCRRIARHFWNKGYNARKEE